MSDVELREVQGADVDDVLATMRRFFGQPPDPGQRHLQAVVAHATLARLDGADAGTAATLDLRLTVPGGATLPMDGVTVVVVSPVARRRGVLRAMMDRLLADARGRGVALLGLGATESSIYRRFGYGVATHAGILSVETAHAAFRAPVADAGRLRMVRPEDAIPTWLDVERRQTQRVGAINRPEAMWHRHLANAPRHDTQGILQTVVHEDGTGVVDGFVNYRQEHRWREEVADDVVRVEQMASLTRPAHLSMWQHLLRLDLAEHLEMERFWLDDPIQHVLADPRRLRILSRDDLHLRVVDVAAALGARRYSREDSLVIEVRDAACPDIEGRYFLEGGMTAAGCARTDAAADVVLDAPSLGSILLGDVSVAALYAAGLVEERTAGAVRRASAMFAWQPRPWLTYMF